MIEAYKSTNTADIRLNPATNNHCGNRNGNGVKNVTGFSVYR